MERASRPQQLINIELLEVSTDSAPNTFRADIWRNPYQLVQFVSLQELSNIHELYDKLKTSVSASSEQGVSSINLIHKDPVPELRSIVMDFYKWQHKEVRPLFIKIRKYVVILTLLRLFSLHASLSSSCLGMMSWCVLSCQDGADKDEDSGEGTSSQQEVSNNA